MTDSTTDTAPSPPPREVSARVRSRAWAEPRVKFWWLAAVGLLLVSAYYFASQLWTWSYETDLVLHGPIVQAKVEAADSMPAPGHKLPPGAFVDLSYDYNGQHKEVTGWLADRKEFIVTGENVPIHVDAKNPDRWTGRTTPAPLWREMLGLAIPLPIILLLAVVSLLRHARIKHVWRDGMARPAIVVEVQQTAMAPRTRAVRCTSADDSSHRVFTVYTRRGHADLEPGDSLWVLSRPNHPDPAVAASWFE